MGRFQNDQIDAAQRRPAETGLSLSDGLRIVLVHPRIPQNTGSVARLCAATGSRLDLIAPLFAIDDAKLRRAGLDYWPLLDVKVYASVDEWREQNASTKPWFVELGAAKAYTEAKFEVADTLVFGDEQAGVPQSWLREFPERHISIPQRGVRSMNLAMCAGIVSFEALRQLEFRGLQLGPRTS
ncbi:MAG TPA: tRNA (cytidine(34)-2'-O)-methyltransferase [Bdellovibrionota bacterium]|jgi:tRNA (cytidine/uridine-2'-O-)-methyltransferase|nr:tRNA (cytidine(34)-2'-O)-methyltransferase [Bdellovibrionota bacterium]